MTDTEAEALGKRLVACRHFRPLRGMLDMQGRTWDTSLLWRWSNVCDVPDLRDPATLGCVLALVRETRREPRLVVARIIRFDLQDRRPQEEGWQVRFSSNDGAYEWTSSWAPTEAEALVAALEAAP